MNATEGRNGFTVLNSFYYLAPLWFVVETFFWPNFRAGVVFGQSTLGTAAFYSVEAGLGAALWFKLPFAGAGALLENVAYLIFAMKFILYAPVDAALNAETAMTTEFARNYAAAMPGMLYSMLHVGLKIQGQIGGLRPGRPG